ncbi:DUF5610 domain-containing protein [Alteromonas gilva]|uniref:DUF5610 domain-containing protein n=1 Tax=Alteromonas gilva TaxID=2987522 RepID=A0ABT5L5K3_9ALTE|nr:DUF5610 domain-containing protein [Alteromonas gilva]MDC8832332.1 DUF5610 domain-containing protein [Alteromonas gilva]
MTVESIPAAKGAQTTVEKPDVALKKQLQQEGLRQAREFQQNSQLSNTKVVADQPASQVSVSQSRVASSLLVSSFEQQVVINERRYNNAQYDTPSEEKLGFDFEKVASNVLKFVGGVVRGAAKSGADEATLTDLLGQARSGVAKGIAMAEKDLAGFMNPEISDGIRNSREAIGTGINKLEDEVLSPFRDTAINGATLSGALGESQQAGLRIRTKDGDEVEINFGQSRQLRYSVSQQNTYYANSEGNNDGNNSAPVAQTQTSASMEYFEYRGLSFSVKGELDKQELTAISDLLKQITDVSKSFFDGDLDKALDKALDLGFDENELEGFALKLNQQQIVSEKISAYQEVGQSDASELKQYLRPIKEYMEELKSMNDLLDSTVQDGGSYQSLVNGVINQMKEVHVPDVVSAINRFHQFNGKLNGPKQKAE